MEGFASVFDKAESEFNFVKNNNIYNDINSIFNNLRVDYAFIHNCDVGCWTR